MKKNFFLVLFLISTSFITQAQEAEPENTSPKNIVKINLLSLPLKNITLQYERAIAKKITVAGTFRYMPTGSIPLKNTFIRLADDPEAERQINNLNVGNKAFMPEIRFYLGKKGAFRGFYLGPFASIARYDADLLFEYDDNGTTETIPMKGNISALTGGLMVGAQFKLNSSLYLDWWILGPNYGGSNGDISGKKTLDASDQQSLRDELDNLDVPLTKFSYTVDGNGATVNFKGPWAGVRAGLCVGIRF